MSQVAKVLSVAKAEVGTHEKRSGGHWVNDSKYNRWFGKIPGYDQDGYGWPWCAAYVAWVAAEADVAELYPKTAGCETAVAWYKRQGRFSEYPAIGGQVFFGKGGGAHTGIVYDYDDTYIYTYEGNTNVNGSAEGDGVYAKKRLRKDAYVYGYGYPKFAEGIKSADPKFKDEAPKPAPAKPAPKPAPKPVSKIVSLDSAVKPGARHAQVKDLQRFLTKAGYGPIPGAYTTYYGPETQKAVARFHNRNAHLKSAGVSYDPVIGKSGFKELQKEAGIK
ncbi:peptidoglycan-binding protein [Streptomyces pseudovenezuelae]|uniref:C40 family peptidase n=1 Tax=Streptomyces pseudovenezuelae TaxID=67350 RepID=UPI002E3034D1|nr:peptidoglycan-binding protein [Streptomyces pseudovenezuelae]